MSGTLPTMTVSATGTWAVISAGRSPPGSRMSTETVTSSRIWCRVWLMPASVNWLRNTAWAEPTVMTSTGRSKPRPERKLIPVRLPTGMARLWVSISSTAATASLRMLVRRSLRAAMLLVRAVMRPLSSFSTVMRSL